MRITVCDVLGYLASGMTQEEILKDFPYLTAEDIKACLNYAADRERRSVAGLKLLFDQNLSPRLFVSLKIIYPDSSHVQTVGLDRTADEKSGNMSKNDFIVVTKDVDFFERGLLKGYPPKVVLIRRGIVQLLRSRTCCANMPFHE